MEYNEPGSAPKSDPVLMQSLIETVIARQNDQAQAIADLRTKLERIEAVLDEATHMTSDEYGQQVVEQIMASLPAIQAAALKKAKAKPLNRGGRR